ncbi:hypothetical protein STENM327S_08291 [Streptomyces tendae]
MSAAESSQSPAYDDRRIDAPPTFRCDSSDPNPDRQAINMPDVNECQICGAPAPLITGQCDSVAGYRLLRDPWAPKPSFLDGNLHFSCLSESDRNGLFFDEFTRMLRAGHEEIESLDGSLPPLTRMGLGMTEIFSWHRMLRVPERRCRSLDGGETQRAVVPSTPGRHYGTRPRRRSPIFLGRRPVPSSGRPWQRCQGVEPCVPAVRPGRGGSLRAGRRGIRSGRLSTPRNCSSSTWRAHRCAYLVKRSHSSRSTFRITPR